jgi:hypothetical protein
LLHENAWEDLFLDGCAVRNQERRPLRIMKRNGAELMRRGVTVADAWEMDETEWEDFREAYGGS